MERMDQKPKIIAVVGPTATGKSDLAVELARRFGGEIVSADSRQVYRGLDLGTGKVSKREMRGIPHHLLDVADPKRAYSVARFQRDGRKAVAGILSRGKVPIVVGGTGFYIDALLFDMRLPNVKPDLTLRKRLERESTEGLCAKLASLDPERFASIDRKNRVRLVRAIEIATFFGPVAPVTIGTPYDVLGIGLRAGNDSLRERISVRLARRMKRGMLAEFERLHEGGLSWERMEALGLEYRYGARLLRGTITKEVFVSELTREIHRYAKRQMTWWRRNDSIRWFAVGDSNAGGPVPRIDDLVRDFLE